MSNFRLKAWNPRFARAKHDGDAYEGLVEHFHARCVEAGAGRLRKVPVPTKGPPGHMYPAEKSNVDYEGHLCCVPPLPVYAECKGTRDPDGLELSAVQDHQRAILDEAHAHGCVALLLVVLWGTAAAGPTLHAVPWVRARHRTRLPPAWLAPYRVAPDEPYLRRFWPAAAGSSGVASSNEGAKGEARAPTPHQVASWLYGHGWKETLRGWEHPRARLAFDPVAQLERALPLLALNLGRPAEAIRAEMLREVA